jgi:hypothetical protein
MTISIINASSVCEDAEVGSWLAALQTQVHEHFNPVWGVWAPLTFVPSHQPVAADDWQIVVVDDPITATKQNIYDLTPTKKPLGKVFAKNDLFYGISPSVSVSHQLLEMLVDPWLVKCCMWTGHSTSGPFSFYSQEICDPVAMSSYEIDGVAVSDFVTPSWFGQSDITTFNYLKTLKQPYADLLHGAQGPASYREIALPGSRRERRQRAGGVWWPSKPGPSPT